MYIFRDSIHEESFQYILFYERQKCNRVQKNEKKIFTVYEVVMLMTKHVTTGDFLLDNVPWLSRSVMVQIITLLGINNVI